MLAACVVFAALVSIGEILLIYLAGRIVDSLAASAPETFLADNLAAIILIVAALLFLWPAVVLLHALFLNQAVMPNLGTLVRWRSHRHVIRQSVGWFENDFAGRISNRIMQTAPATGEAVYHVLSAGVYALTYVAAAGFLLLGTDTALLLPLLAWSVLYLVMMFRIIPKIGQASKVFSDARSAITGRVVDSYTNIQSVKLFAHSRIEEDYAYEVIESARKAFQRQMRLISMMEFQLTCLNVALKVAVCGTAILLWSRGEASIGAVAAATALTLRLSAMTGWIMWAMSSLFQQLGIVSEGMMTIAQPLDLTDIEGRADARADRRRDPFPERHAPLREALRRPERCLAHGAGRRESRIRRPFRGRQVDPRQASPQVLRHRIRTDRHRRGRTSPK